jgi:outer membrane lipoprotein SlyB
MKAPDNDDMETEAASRFRSVQARHARSASVGTIIQSSPVKHPKNQFFFMKSVSVSVGANRERLLTN